MTRLLTLSALILGVLWPHAPATAQPYVIDPLVSGLNRPWGMVFLPDGTILITEKHGSVRAVRPGGRAAVRVPGGPSRVLQVEDSGLLDIATDPDFTTNRTIYIAFSQGDLSANRTSVWKARYAGGRLSHGKVIFRARTPKKGAGHPGGRLLFLPDKTLLLTIGDGYDFRAEAQNRRSPLGKVVRMDRSGRAPDDNPFPVQPHTLPEVFTWGHRNPQGLLRDPRDGTIWLHEHGPKGGDEINQLKPGSNYGWPKTTHGIDYSGDIISDLKEAPGIEPPAVVWVPSIAPSGFALYLGDKFPEWQGDFFLGALVNRSLFRIRLHGGRPVQQEELLKELGARIRDVREGPDGFIYVLTDDKDGQLLRLRPPS